MLKIEEVERTYWLFRSRLNTSRSSSRLKQQSRRYRCDKHYEEIICDGLRTRLPCDNIVIPWNWNELIRCFDTEEMAYRVSLVAPVPRHRYIQFQWITTLCKSNATRSYRPIVMIMWIPKCHYVAFCSVDQRVTSPDICKGLLSAFFTMIGIKRDVYGRYQATCTKFTKFSSSIVSQRDNRGGLFEDIHVWRCYY